MNHFQRSPPVVPLPPAVRRVVTTPMWMGLALFVLSLALNLHDLDHRPGYPNFYEDTVITRELRPGITSRPALDLPWSRRYRILREWGNGDADHVGFAWPWVLAVDKSRELFGETPLGHRLPSALLCALSPVVFFHLVRRFFLAGYFRLDV